MYPCPYCGEPGIPVWRKACLGPAVPATCLRCQRLVGVPWFRSFVAMLPFFVGMSVPPVYLTTGLFTDFLDPTTWGAGEWAVFGTAYAALFVVTWLVSLAFYLRWVPLIRADWHAAAFTPSRSHDFRRADHGRTAAAKVSLRQYWLGRSIPEFAGLPMEARRQLWRGEVARAAPWLLAALLPFVACCVLVGGFAGAWAVLAVLGDESVWTPFAGYFLGCAAAGAVCLLIARPVMIHFLRPRLRRAREVAEEWVEQSAATKPDATS